MLSMLHDAAVLPLHAVLLLLVLLMKGGTPSVIRKADATSLEREAENAQPKGSLLRELAS